MWKIYYQAQLKEMESRNIQPGFEDIPIYYDEYSDEASSDSYHDQGFCWTYDDAYDEDKQLRKLIGEQSTLRKKRKREDDDDGDLHDVKRQRGNFLKTEEKLIEEDLIEIVEDPNPIDIKGEEKSNKISQWIQENMPYREDTPVISQMREWGLLEKNEKVTGFTINKPIPKEEAPFVLVAPEFGKEDNNNVYIKKISLKKATDQIPKEENDLDMKEKPGSHILAKDLNRRIVLKKTKK